MIDWTQIQVGSSLLNFKEVLSKLWQSFSVWWDLLATRVSVL